MRHVLLSVVACGCLLAGTARAQTPSPLAEWQYSAGVLLRSSMAPSIPEWDVSVGAASELHPQYPGAKSYHVEVGPLFDLRYKDIAFASTGEGLGVNLLHGKTYRAGVALSYDLGRKAGENERLRGLPDINGAPEAKLFAELVHMPIVLRADVRRALGGYNGWSGDVGAYMPLGGSDKFFVMAGPSLTLGDTTKMQSYYGITAAQATRSNLAEHSAQAGAERAGIGASAIWFFADHWLATADAAAQELLASAATSPVTERRLELALSLGIAYHF